MRKESDTQPSDGLEIVVIKSFEEIEANREVWEQMQADKAYPQINADIDWYLSVVKTRTKDIRPYIMLIKQHGIVVSMMIGQLQNTRIKCNLGRMTLFKPLLRELAVVYGGVLGNLTDEIRSLLIEELMNVLRRGEVDVVVFNHLKTDSPMYRSVRKIPGLPTRGYLPKTEIHWFMAMPANMEDFYKSLSPKHRSNLRRYIRNLEKSYPGQLKIVTYTKEHEVEEAIATASEISATTYQHAFGYGIVNCHSTREFLRQAAKKGWLRLHILYINEKPAAFQTTFKYGRICFGYAVGFDPKWKRFRIGTVLFLKIMEKLCADPAVQHYDFGIGDTEYKQHYGNGQWPEASVLIFASRPFPLFVNLIRSSTLAMSMFAQYVITSLGIHDLVRRYRRRRILRKTHKYNPIYL